MMTATAEWDHDVGTWYMLINGFPVPLPNHVMNELVPDRKVTTITLELEPLYHHKDGKVILSMKPLKVIS